MGEGSAMPDSSFPSKRESSDSNEFNAMTLDSGSPLRGVRNDEQKLQCWSFEIGPRSRINARPCAVPDDACCSRSRVIGHPGLARCEYTCLYLDPGTAHIHVLSGMLTSCHQLALWIARLSTDSAASCTTSLRVGCAWTMRARSSDAPLNSIATTASAISSDTTGPHMCTPRMRSVSACAITFTRPAGSFIATARPLAANGNEPVLYGVPSALHCCSVLPVQAISGSV